MKKLEFHPSHPSAFILRTSPKCLSGLIEKDGRLFKKDGDVSAKDALFFCEG